MPRNKHHPRVSPEEGRASRKASGVDQDLQKERESRAGAINEIRNDSRFANSIKNGDSAGGSLTGNFPSPTIKADGVISGMLSSDLLQDRHFFFVSGVGRTLPPGVVIRRTQVPPNTIGQAELSSSTTDDAVRAVAGPNIRDNAIIDRAIASNAVGRRAIAGGAVGSTQIEADAVTSPKMAANAVGDRELSSVTDFEAVGLAHMRSGTKNASHSISSMRSMGSRWGGDSLQASPSDHAHSVSAKQLPYPLRRELLEARAKIPRYLSRTEAPNREEINELWKWIGAIAHMQLDDSDRRAEDREREIQAEPEKWKERFPGDEITRYREVHGAGRFGFQA